MNKAEVADICNYRVVDAKLSASGQPTEEQLAAAAQEGFEVVINLALHDDPRYSLRDEPGWVEALGMTYIHIPVRFDAPAEADLLTFFAELERCRDRTVLLHCAYNKRVTAFLGLHGVIRQGRPLEEAFALMRSVWEPDSTWSSFIGAMIARHGG